MAQTETIIYVGDVRDRLKEVPDNIVHCCVTSPPYFSLRDYGTAGEWQGGSPDCTHQRTNDRAKVPQGVQGRIERQTGQEEAKRLGFSVPDDVHNRYPSAGKAVGGGKFVCTKCGAVKIDKQIGLEASSSCGLQGKMRLKKNISPEERELVLRRLLDVGRHGV